MSQHKRRNGGHMHGPVAMAGDKPKNFKGSAKRLLSWLKALPCGTYYSYNLLDYYNPLRGSCAKGFGLNYHRAV